MSVITTNYLENVTERNAKLRKITHKLWKLNPEFKRQGLLQEGFSALRGEETKRDGDTDEDGDCGNFTPGGREEDESFKSAEWP